MRFPTALLISFAALTLIHAQRARCAGNLTVRAVSMPNKPAVQTPGQLWGGAVGGVLGAVIANGLTKQESYAAFLAENNVQVDHIVNASFEEEISKRSPLPVTSTRTGQLSLNVAVVIYGIHGAGPFSAKAMEPLLGVEASLVDEGGNTIWRDTEKLIFPSSKEVAPHTMDDYRKDPSLLRAGYKALADILAARAIGKLASFE